jgi:glutathione S-transferase
MSDLTLVSHVLCPYVQRAVIALTEKAVPFARRDVDLAAKPAWFTALSPLGKVPLLVVGPLDAGSVVFESAVILEYIEDTQANPLHPADPLDRAQHRAWIEFGSAQLATIARLYNAKSEPAFEAECDALRRAFLRLEDELARRRSGPYFAGARMSLVDAAFGPVFRYFDGFEADAGLQLLTGLPRMAAWRTALSERESVRTAVVADYPARLATFLKNRDSVLAGRMTGP